MLSPIRALVHRFNDRRAAASAVSLGVLTLLASASLTLVSPLAPAGAAGAANIDLNQCANDDDIAGNCSWVPGNLNQNNSEWFEGMSVPQRVLLRGIDSSDDPNHVLTIQHQATKGGVHAYDWLTSYAQAQAAAADFGLPLTLDECGASFQPNAAGVTACNSVFPGGFSATVDIPDDPFVSSTPAGPGTTPYQPLIAAYEAQYGNRTLTLWGNAPISNVTLTLTHNPAADESDTGDSTIGYALNFTSTSTNVIVQFAAHLAVGTGGWGVNLGAGNIQGSTNDVRLVVGAFDGQGGAQTNPINSNAIATSVSAINISKVVTAGPDADFDFNFDPPGASPVVEFILNDGETEPFTPLAPGQYVVSEDPEGGYVLDNIQCSAGTVAIDVLARTATITLAPNQTISCTFFNRLTTAPPTAVITVAKLVEGGGTTPFDFVFTSPPNDGDITSDFVLQHGQTEAFPGLVPGDYIITEPGEPGFELVGIDCGAADVTPGPGAGEVTVHIDDADNVLCTFTNAPIVIEVPLGEIVITKEAAGADGVTFDFTFDPPGADNTVDFDLLAGDSADFADLVPGGPFVVTELDEAGWDLLAISCNDGADVTILGATVSINVDGGEVVECTFTNRPEPIVPGTGRIIVAKVADEYDTDTEFPFVSSFDGALGDGTDFTLEAGESEAFDLAPGSYAVNEIVPADWDLVSATCSDGSPIGAILLDEDEIITCTFTNELEDEDDGYNQYPGDNDFDFDTPFDDAGGPAPQTPTGDVAGSNAGVNNQGQPSDQPSVAGDTTAQGPAGDPAAMAELPRTGAGVRHLTMMAGILLIIGGLANLAGPRRRRAHQN